MDESQVLTWTQLVKLEPRLGQLHLDCRFADHHDPSGFDAELAWNGSLTLPGLKNRLDLLVGPNAEVQDPRIRTSQAYALASEECQQALAPNRSGIRRPESQENQITASGQVL